MDSSHLRITEQRDIASLEQPPILFTQGFCFRSNCQRMVKTVTGNQHPVMCQQTGITFAEGCHRGIRQLLGTEQGIRRTRDGVSSSHGNHIVAWRDIFPYRQWLLQR